MAASEWEGLCLRSNDGAQNGEKAGASEWEV